MISTLTDIELNIDKTNWRPVCLGDVVEESREVMRDPVIEGIERVVGLEHIDSASLHLRRWETLEQSTTFTKKFVEGQVLFGRRRAYLKKAALAPFDGICSGDITVLEARKDLLPELLPFLISDDKFFDFAIKNSAGSLSPRAKFKDLANYEFLLPPKDEQAHLAELLWAADEMLESLHKVQRRMESVRVSLHRDYFKHYKSSAITIGDCAEKVGSGVTPLGGAKVYTSEGIRFIRSQNVLRGQFDFSDVAFISKEIDEDMSSTRVTTGDVLLNITGASIGRCAVYIDNIPANVNQHVCIIRTTGNLNPFFLEEFINSEYGQNQIDLLQAGGNREGLNFANIKRLRVPNHNLNAQLSMMKKFGKIKESLNSATSQIERIKQLQKSLINQIF